LDWAINKENKSVNTSTVLPIIAILGGTGKEGMGLAFRWAKYGYRIQIGSRLAEKAKEKAYELQNMIGGNTCIEGTTNLEAAQTADIVVLVVPYSAHRLLLEEVKEALQGKILVDVTVPLIPPKVTTVQMPAAGSAAEEAHNILGGNVQVTGAFHNISSKHLLGSEASDCDVLVTGTSKEARIETLKLVTAAGFIGWDAGVIENSAVTEGLTSVLIYINKQYGSTNAGIRLTGVNMR
jgi:8-hydroxy-5-deazaflavin:NADPH oxidoreductase